MWIEILQSLSKWIQCNIYTGDNRYNSAPRIWLAMNYDTDEVRHYRIIEYVCMESLTCKSAITGMKGQYLEVRWSKYNYVNTYITTSK